MEAPKKMSTHAKMRDPIGSEESYAEFFRVQEMIDNAFPPFEELDEEDRNFRAVNTYGRRTTFALRQYGRGDSLVEIQAILRRRMPEMIEMAAWYRAHAEGAAAAAYRPLKASRRESYGFFALAALTLDQPEELAKLRELLPTQNAERGQFLDLMVKAMIPDYPMLASYKPVKEAALFTDPVLRILALPPDARAQAVDGHLQKWCRMMRAFGWKPDLDPGIGKDPLFCDFAYEVALAVAAYDIDDSAFRDHPYYPGDLVEFYRIHVRDTRDGWRAKGVGAGTPIAVPPPPQRADLSKSKSKGLARWIELVCDGDPQAVEAVLEIVGKPRKFKSINGLMEALASEGHAIEADIKDDDTVSTASVQLTEARDIAGFVAPGGPPFGPDRCQAILAGLARHCENGRYRLLDLDNQDDGWHAVLVRAEYVEEFRQASDALGIMTRTPDEAYGS